MQRISKAAAATAAVLCLAFSTYPARAQDAKKLAGTWKLVSNINIDAAGKRSDLLGANPVGQAIFTANGRYVIYLASSSLPKFAANSRLKGTADENKAIVTGFLAHEGSYTVDAKDKSFTLHIDSSSYPNWDGTSQKRPYTLSGNDLKWSTAAASGGGSAELTWKRVK
jgi:hypothetical protein